MLALDEHPNVFDSTLVDRMVKIGIPLKDAQTLYADSEENRIRAALQMTEQRMRSTSLPPVRSAAALFGDALKEGLCATAARSVAGTGGSGENQRSAGGRPEGAFAKRIFRVSPEGSALVIRGTR